MFAGFIWSKHLACFGVTVECTAQIESWQRNVLCADLSAVRGDEATAEKRSSQLRSYELKVKSLQQEN